MSQPKTKPVLRLKISPRGQQVSSPPIPKKSSEELLSKPPKLRPRLSPRTSSASSTTKVEKPMFVPSEELDLTLFPVRCMTCGKPLGRYQKKHKLPGEKEFKPGYQELIAAGKTFEQATKELGIVRPCCKTRILSSQQHPNPYIERRSGYMLSEIEGPTKIQSARLETGETKKEEEEEFFKEDVYEEDYPEFPVFPEVSESESIKRQTAEVPRRIPGIVTVVRKGAKEKEVLPQKQEKAILETPVKSSKFNVPEVEISEELSRELSKTSLEKSKEEAIVEESLRKSPKGRKKINPKEMESLEKPVELPPVTTKPSLVPKLPLSKGKKPLPRTRTFV